jgi:CheY-like chemotaxis protein
MDLEPGHPARASVEDIETTAERAADLTRQLLAYAGRWPVAVESVDLAHLVEEMAQLLRAAVSRRAHLEVSCEPDTPRVTGDATQLRQIVMNLIRNAGDALEQGAGTIRVRANGRSTPPSPAEGRVFGEPLTDGIRYACVEVQDTGIGMSPETLGRIFDPFFSEKASGRGLGLATSLRIVRSHGGSIHVRTAPGRGSTFTLLFPAEGAPPRDAAPEPASPTDLEGRGTILVVDDEAGVRDVAAQLLRRAGFEVRTAANGREALDVLRGQRSAIRALVLDLTMPVMGGEATLREIRADDPDLPVVLMSGFADTEVGALLGGDRATAFVDKPFRGPVLREALARVLEATGR